MLTPSPMPSLISHTLFDIISLGVIAVVCMYVYIYIYAYDLKLGMQFPFDLQQLRPVYGYQYQHWNIIENIGLALSLILINSYMSTKCFYWNYIVAVWNLTIRVPYEVTCCSVQNFRSFSHNLKYRDSKLKTQFSGFSIQFWRIRQQTIQKMCIQQTFNRVWSCEVVTRTWMILALGVGNTSQ